VKFTILFRGREIAHTEPGFKMCKEVIERVGEAAIVELAPKLEGKKLMMILAPNPQFKKK
jgi:translation initiation factor IF-3